MDKLNDVLYALIPWICCLVVLSLFSKLIGWARKRKGAAIAIGLLVQMFIPDPKVEETIQMVVEQKQQKVKELQESGEPEVDEVNRET